MITTKDGKDGFSPVHASAWRMFIAGILYKLGDVVMVGIERADVTSRVIVHIKPIDGFKADMSLLGTAKSIKRFKFFFQQTPGTEVNKI